MMEPIRAGVPRAVLVVVALVLAGCGVGGGSDGAGAATVDRGATTSVPTTDATTAPTLDPDEGRGDVIEDPPEETEVPTSMVTVTDPVNQAFTVQVPEGWDSLAYSNVEGQLVRQVVTTASPDGAAVVFVGDPKIPSYWKPGSADEMTVRFAEMLDSMELAEYVPAEQYVVNYVTEKFGDLEGFSIDGTTRLTEREQSLYSQASAAGVTLVDVQVAQLRFSFVSDGEARSGVVTVGTMDNGAVWSADVNGAAAAGDVERFVGLVDSIAASRQILPEFQATLQQRHQATMDLIAQRTEEMTRRHEANMQWIQDSANAHQQRMQAIWASNDAQIASYYDRMASMDVGHREFLNYINDERTVQTSSGTKHQVDDSYQRYWMNPTTGQYYGGDINFGESQLRELGLNPSDFEEVQIIRG